MSSRGKAFIAASAVAMSVVVAMLLWPRGYIYRGRSVEAWFRDCANDQWVKDYPGTGEIGPSGEVFRSMGTNAVPFLASRITRDLAPSRLERWLSRPSGRTRLTTKEDEAIAAALLVSKYVNPPKSMLRELLKPAMSTTNDAQSIAVEIALGERPTPPAITSMNKSVGAVVTVLEPRGRRTVQMTNSEHIRLIEGWLQEVKSTQLLPEQLGAVAPWCTVTFYADSNPTSTNEIFAIDGGATRRQLLKDEQRQKLINIIDRK